MNRYYTEDEFYQKIEDKTRRSIQHGDYGFIMGRACPFTPNGGMMVSNLDPNFTVWKKHNGKTYAANIPVTENQEEILQNVISFLNLDFLDMNKTE